MKKLVIIMVLLVSAACGALPTYQKETNQQKFMDGCILYRSASVVNTRDYCEVEWRTLHR